MEKINLKLTKLVFSYLKKRREETFVPLENSKNQFFRGSEVAFYFEKRQKRSNKHPTRKRFDYMEMTVEYQRENNRVSSAEKCITECRGPAGPRFPGR